VEAQEDDLPLMLTEKEASNGTCIRWVTPEEAVRLIESQDVTLDSRKFVQARDLAALTRGGYRAELCQPVDMFPHTNHIESVVKLTRAGL
jgi:hypothetical protein